ncbi:MULTISPECIES: hypothetical protein [Streptacidiphilus]|uniref:Uncharacterized protein n=1 Tax=Streptacidiphilus cavernicola TaxID=3342716 RepID=A0ABV6V1K8_9ACTN|nr:hypothetical protein [Streptacidiphilus jeojiense]
MDKIGGHEIAPASPFIGKASTAYLVTLIGQHAQAVVMKSMTARKIRCYPAPPRATIIVTPNAGAALIEGMLFDLDRGGTALRFTGGETRAESQSYFDQKQVSLGKYTDPVTFHITALSNKTCDWVIDAVYIDGRSVKSMEIMGPEGKPFSVYASSGVENDQWDWPIGAWYWEHSVTQ